MHLAGAILANSFVQVNTIRGYRYLDDAGRIMNKYEERFPDLKVGLDGLQMTNPDAKLHQAKVTTQQVWLHFAAPDTLTYVIDQGIGFVTDVCATLDIVSFSRVGWRNQFVLSADANPQLITAARNNLFSTPLLQFAQTPKPTDKEGFEAMLQTQSDDFTLAIRLNIGRRPENSDMAPHLPETAIMLDVDAFQTEKTDVRGLRRFMRSAEAWCQEHIPQLAQLVTAGGTTP